MDKSTCLLNKELRVRVPPLPQIDTTVSGEVKAISFGWEVFYCLGNCDLCKIRFSCWTNGINDTTWTRREKMFHFTDETIEYHAFGNVIGRVVYFGSLGRNTIHYKQYVGGQIKKELFKNSKLYIKDNKVMCREPVRVMYCLDCSVINKGVII